VLGDAERLKQWSIEIRAENLMAELMGPISLEGNPADESFTAFHIGSDGNPLQIAKVIRPKVDVFQQQVQLVVNTVPLRAERLQEIIVQIGIPIQFWANILDLNPTTTPFTLELLALALTFGSGINQPCKHTLGCPRPAAYSPSVQPVINPRRFGCFPSGHCLEAFMVARLLQLLTGQRGDQPEGDLEKQLQRLAMRISDNRVIGGVHFPIDSVAGRMMGETLATYFAHRSGHLEEGWVPHTFDGKQVPKDQGHFNRHDALHHGGHNEPPPYFEGNDGEALSVEPFTVVKGGDSLLNWLWRKAQAEWGAEPDDRQASAARRKRRRKS
jgi:membrane-associated phospholipid phosphatase